VLLLRVILTAAFAASVLLGAPAAVARAEDDDAAAVAPDEVAEALRGAFAEFRAGLAALREACRSRTDEDEDRPGRRFGTKLKECERGLRELRDFLQQALEGVRELRQQLKEEREHAAERAKEEQRKAEQEARKAAERAKEQRAKEQKNKEQKDKAEQVAYDLQKKRAHYEGQLHELTEAMKRKLAEQARLQLSARELRERAATASGEERERLLGKAAEAERAAAELAAYGLKYAAQKQELQAALDRLGKSAAPVAHKEDLAGKIEKYRQMLADLDGKIAYKMSEHDRYHQYAKDLRDHAAGLAGAEREKYLSKADDADRQADEWESAAHGYQAQRGEIQAALDALLGR